MPRDNEPPLLLKYHVTLLSQSHLLSQQLLTEYQAMIPKLPIPASREDCESAMNLLISQDGEFYEKWMPRKQDFVLKLKEHLQQLQGVQGFESLWLETRSLMRAWQERNQPVDRANRLQLTVQGLVEGQKGGLKRWYLTECVSFGFHLDRTTGTVQRAPITATNPPTTVSKPSITVSKPPTTPRFQSSTLPLEIASTIYSYCDVETCETLRQTSSFWYGAFRESDHVIKQVLAARNPWFQLEADLVTWGQCLLVFAARLRSWKVVENVAELTTAEETNTGLEKFLTATSLKFGETLPVDFESLSSCLPCCDSYNCGKVHLTHGGEKKVVDVVDGGVKKMERVVVETRTFCEQEKEHKDELSTSVKVLKVRDFEITLPESVDLLKSSPLTCYNHHILVKTRTKNFLFHRNKPLHYKHAITYPASSEPGKELGSFYFHRNELLDPCRRKFTPLPLSLQPSAIYKGVLWCRESETYTSEVLMTPTFVDLNSPSKIYHNPAKSLLTNDPWNCLTQMTSRENTHLVTAMNPLGLTVVDLETIQVTCVLKPDFEEVNKRSRAGRERLLPGFVRNKFQVWYVDLEWVRRYTMKAWGLKEVDSDDLIT